MTAFVTQGPEGRPPPLGPAKASPCRACGTPQRAAKARAARPGSAGSPPPPSPPHEGGGVVPGTTEVTGAPHRFPPPLQGVWDIPRRAPEVRGCACPAAATSACGPPFPQGAGVVPKRPADCCGRAWSGVWGDLCGRLDLLHRRMACALSARRAEAEAALEGRVSVPLATPHPHPLPTRGRGGAPDAGGDPGAAWFTSTAAWSVGHT
jgi:hypothetical protein